MARRAFTLIELLVFAAIFTVIMIGFITMLVTVTRVQSRQSSSNEVETQGQFLLQQVQYYIQSARLADMVQDVATGTLKVRMASSSLDPTFITLATGTVYLQQGPGAAPQALTSNKVTVTGLTFTRRYNLNNSSTAFGTDSVSYSFTMAANTTNATQQYSQTFRSSAAVLAPVPKIALVQQVSAASAATVPTLSATYAASNATGSLLVAAVSNANLVSVSIATDTAGNTWNKIGSVSYAAYSQEVTILAALNAKNGPNAVTASFGGGGALNPSLFLYEYRGAAAASSFDATSTALATGTVLSSGFANPASGAELVLGALFLSATPPTPPAAGSGFTIESSSSINNTFIEDQDLYVTGPVAATWTISPAATSAAIVATFK